MGPLRAIEPPTKRDFLKGTAKAFARGVSAFDANDVLAYVIAIGKSVDTYDCATILRVLTEQGDLVCFASDGSPNLGINGTEVDQGLRQIRSCSLGNIST